MALKNPRLRSFVKLDKYGQVVPGSLIQRLRPPSNGLYPFLWYEITSDICCTSTTTSTTSTTTTTTTTV